MGAEGRFWLRFGAFSPRGAGVFGKGSPGPPAGRFCVPVCKESGQLACAGLCCLVVVYGVISWICFFTTERTEENGRRRNCQLCPNPPRRRMRSIYAFFATPGQWPSSGISVSWRKTAKSPALGIEGVLRKVRDERRRTATKPTRFRYALSNRTCGRFSAFSPCQREATGSLKTERRKARIIGRIHSAALTARFRVGLTFFSFRFFLRFP